MKKQALKKVIKKATPKHLTVDQKLDVLIVENKKFDLLIEQSTVWSTRFDAIDIRLDKIESRLGSVESLSLENQETIHFVKDYVVKEFERVDERFGQMQSSFVRHGDTAQVNKIELQTDVQAMRAEIADIKEKLENLADRTHSTQGFSVEIDNLRARVKKIEGGLVFSAQRHIVA
jgi:hypothetical protein